MHTRLPRVGLAAIATAFALVHPGGALAQEPTQVTGLAAVQGDGFATLSWNAVAGATDCRSSVRRWTPPTSPRARRRSSASGSRRARGNARRSPSPASFSRRAFLLARPSAVRDDGAAVLGAGLRNDESAVGRRPRCFLRTPFEETNGATYTNDVNEYFYTGALDAASERMRVVEIGRTLLGRPINMFIFGYPGPLPSAEQISESPTTLIQCHVHGNEPSMRESCLILARELAFTDDPTLLRILERSTVLIVPTLNGDGRAATPAAALRVKDLTATTRC